MRTWGRLLGNIQNTDPNAEIAFNPDNVVRLRPMDWEQLERDIVAANNAVVHWRTEEARASTKALEAEKHLRLAQARFAEKAKDLGALVNFPLAPGEGAEMSDEI